MKGEAMVKSKCVLRTFMYDGCWSSLQFQDNGLPSKTLYQRLLLVFIIEQYALINSR